MTWPANTSSGYEQVNVSTSAYESFVGVQHIYVIICLAVPCVFLVAFGAYISHFQGRCDGAVRIFCPCLPTIWEDGRQPPRPRELDAVVVISRIPEQRRTHFYPKKRLSESELACVVVMPDKTKQIAFPQDPVGSGRRIEAALLRPPILFHSMASPVVYVATVAESPGPNSSLSSPNQQQLLPQLSPKDGVESLSQDK